MTHQRLSDRQFGLVFAALFAVLAVVGWLGFDARPYGSLAVAAGFVTIALLAPGVLLPLNRLWGVVTGKLGHIVNFVFLAMFFYGFIMPLGLIFRLMGRDSMARRIGSKDTTYWTRVTRHTDESTLRDMF